MITKFKDFLTEKIDNDRAIDIYISMMRIISIFENYFYKDKKIVNDPDFKSEISGALNNLIEGRDVRDMLDNDADPENHTTADTIMNIVKEFEMTHYKNDLMSDSLSLYDMATYFVEDCLDDDDIEIDHIKNFSEKDIYKNDTVKIENLDDDDEDYEVDGDLVVCIDNKDIYPLTVGEAYVVKKETKTTLEILEDDDGQIREYPKDLFVDADEYDDDEN